MSIATLECVVLLSEKVHNQVMMQCSNQHAYLCVIVCKQCVWLPLGLYIYLYKLAIYIKWHMGKVGLDYPFNEVCLGIELKS